MIEKKIVFFIGLAIIVERVIETVLPDKLKQKGKVTSKWLFNCMLLCGGSVYLMAILEFTFVVNKISIIATYTGIFLIVIRIMLKIWVVRTLGRFWSIQIEIRDDHKLVIKGPYRFMRHPSYLSTMIEATAGPLIFNAYFTIIFVWLFYFPLLLLRIHLEEKELLSKFGKEYSVYRSKVFALLPFKLYRD